MGTWTVAKYSNAEDLEKACNSYFEKCEAEGIRPIVTGLALHLGFMEKKSIYNYRDLQDDRSHPIKKSLMKIESYLESALTNPKLATAGVIFALKNCGWTDKQTIEHESTEDGLTLRHVVSDIKTKEY